MPIFPVEFEVGFLEWSACCAFLMQLCQGANKFMWLNMRVCVCVCVLLSVSLAILAATSLFLCKPSYCLAALINGERKLMRFCVPFLLLLPLCVSTALLLFCFIVSSCAPTVCYTLCHGQKGILGNLIVHNKGIFFFIGNFLTLCRKFCRDR